MYDSDFFVSGIEVLKHKTTQICEAFSKLEEFQESWKFKIFPKYKILLTRYGSGGYYDADEGIIVVRTNSDGTFGKDDVLETIIHEIVHIGIEENIIQKFKLTHWEK